MKKGKHMEEVERKKRKMMWRKVVEIQQNTMNEYRKFCK